MADSIAKLAVIITGDASPLTAALAKAQADTQAFASGIKDPFQRGLSVMKAQGSESWITGLERLKAQGANPLEALRLDASKFTAEAERSAGAAFKMSMALQAARGNVGAISNLIQSGGMTGGLVAAGVAAGILAFKLAAISDAQKVASGANPLDTWAGQWDRVQENAEKIGVTLGRPISNVLTRESRDLANILGMISDMIMPETLRQERELIALRAKQAEQAKADAARREAAAKKAAEEARLLGEELERQGREMESRADALARSLRTPREEMVGAIAEAAELMEKGFLSAQNFERAAEAAKEKFREANKIRERAQSRADSPVAATDRFTMAGFSAVQQAFRDMKAQEEIEKEQTEELKKQTEIEQEIAKILNDRLSTPIVLMEGTPP